MSQSFAVWLVIGISLITANLPFVVQRPFLVLPWAQTGEAPMPAWARGLLSLLFFAVLLALAYAGYVLVAGAVVIGSGGGAIALALGRILAAIALVTALLYYPGWRNRGRAVSKSFLDRLLELLVFYALAGVLGFASEANLGNAFSQTWEFYAITLSLFLVAGYPGFVFRYLLRRRKSGRGASSAS